jgi:hypothetical protein
MRTESISISIGGALVGALLMRTLTGCAAPVPVAPEPCSAEALQAIEATCLLGMQEAAAGCSERNVPVDVCAEYIAVLDGCKIAISEWRKCK